MAPRLRLPAYDVVAVRPQYICLQCRYASLASATTPAPPLQQTVTTAPTIARFPPTQPPSYKRPEFRKTQLHRQYQSLLRSSPLILLFQHNNLRATEWSGIRRELTAAMRKVDEELAKDGDHTYLGSSVKLSVVQTGIFASALRVVEFWEPKFQPETSNSHSTAPSTHTSTAMQGTASNPNHATLTHGLSRQAWEATNGRTGLKHGLEPLLSGPLTLLVMPDVSPQHLKAALSILAPSPDFPAPKRRTNPSYHEKAVQDGLQKLMLLGARIEGRVFDMDGAKWVGKIEGGMTGLRSQLVTMLSGVGAQITNLLEGASKSLYFTMESRRSVLEEEGKGAVNYETTAGKPAAEDPA